MTRDGEGADGVETVDGVEAVELHRARLPLVRPLVAAHPMAASAARASLLDARLRAVGSSLAEHVGAVADRAAAGATIGVPESPDDAAERAGALVEAGYRRLRVKVMPGRDVDVLAAVRDRVGADVTLLADANQSYAALAVDEVADLLRPLEELGLAALEQPLDAADLLGHAELASRLDVPLGLDESVTSLDGLRRILDLRAARVICVKPAHLGGYEQARAAHDLCLDAGVHAFVGGMFDSALGRSANAALAALPGFDIAGDVGPPSAYLAADVADYPALAADGTVAVWSGPGIGPVPAL